MKFQCNPLKNSVVLKELIQWASIHAHLIEQPIRIDTILQAYKFQLSILKRKMVALK